MEADRRSRVAPWLGGPPGRRTAAAQGDRPDRPGGHRAAGRFSSAYARNCPAAGKKMDLFQPSKWFPPGRGTSMAQDPSTEHCRSARPAVYDPPWRSRRSRKSNRRGFRTSATPRPGFNMRTGRHGPRRLFSSTTLDGDGVDGPFSGPSPGLMPYERAGRTSSTFLTGPKTRDLSEEFSAVKAKSPGRRNVPFQPSLHVFRDFPPPANQTYPLTRGAPPPARYFGLQAPRATCGEVMRNPLRTDGHQPSGTS